MITEEQMAQPITVNFLKKNFADYSENNNVYSTTREQSPRCVDVFPNFGKFTVSVYDETMDNVFTALDNVFTASTIGQLVAFLSLCGLQSFTSTLKI